MLLIIDSKFCVLFPKEKCMIIFWMKTRHANVHSWIES